MRQPFPFPGGLVFESVVPEGERLAFELRAGASGAECPLCSRSSTRVHSVYTTKISDLPRHGTPVVLQVRVRRFFCEQPSCGRRS